VAGPVYPAFGGYHTAVDFSAEERAFILDTARQVIRAKLTPAPPRRFVVNAFPVSGPLSPTTLSPLTLAPAPEPVLDSAQMAAPSLGSPRSLSASPASGVQSAAALALADPARSQSPQKQQPLPPALLQPAGCFVSLHQKSNHALRGCIGRMDATQPLMDTLRYSAAAALDDPRFVKNRVTLRDLPRLTLEVSVLSPLVPAANPLAFEPGEHGIYLTIGNRSGVFLPQVARETGWTREQLLDRLCSEKMGLNARAWQDPQARLQTFLGVIVGPEPVE
jgi:AmmeMemoRadiSam system protein A